MVAKMTVVVKNSRIPRQIARETARSRHYSSAQKLARQRTVAVPNSQMLYDHWRELLRECANDVALRDLASGRRWTFADLDSLAAGGASDSIVFPQGSAVEFIVTVLQGWKSGAVVCPLEPGRAR